MSNRELGATYNKHMRLAKKAAQRGNEKEFDRQMALAYKVIVRRAERKRKKWTAKHGESALSMAVYNKLLWGDGV